MQRLLTVDLGIQSIPMQNVSPIQKNHHTGTKSVGGGKKRVAQSLAVFSTENLNEPTHRRTGRHVHGFFHFPYHVAHKTKINDFDGCRILRRFCGCRTHDSKQRRIDSSSKNTVTEEKTAEKNQKGRDYDHCSNKLASHHNPKDHKKRSNKTNP